MHLKPVYLLAPKPEPPTVPSRRAFMIAGGTFLAGAALGGACGYAAGSSAVKSDPDNPSTPASSGNAELDELRRLALKAPIEELTERWLFFIDVFATDYRNDEYLPAGIERLAKHVTTNPGVPQRLALAQSLVQAIELGEKSLRERAGHLIPELRKVR
jgi:hypothetical protein